MVKVLLKWWFDHFNSQANHNVIGQMVSPNLLNEKRSASTSVEELGWKESEKIFWILTWPMDPWCKKKRLQIEGKTIILSPYNRKW